MTFSTLRVAQDGGVATITLARPDRLNALTADMHADLRAALGTCERDESVKVVVLTGEGRAFSSGQKAQDKWLLRPCGPSLTPLIT